MYADGNTQDHTWNASSTDTEMMSESACNRAALFLSHASAHRAWGVQCGVSSPLERPRFVMYVAGARSCDTSKHSKLKPVGKRAQKSNGVTHSHTRTRTDTRTHTTRILKPRVKCIPPYSSMRSATVSAYSHGSMHGSSKKSLTSSPRPRSLTSSPGCRKFVSTATRPVFVMPVRIRLWEGMEMRRTTCDWSEPACTSLVGMHLLNHTHQAKCHSEPFLFASLVLNSASVRKWVLG